MKTTLKSGIIRSLTIFVILIGSWLFLFLSLAYQVFWQRHIGVIQSEADRELVKSLFIPHIKDKLRLILPACRRNRQVCLADISRRRWQTAEMFWKLKRYQLAEAYVRRALGYGQPAMELDSLAQEWERLIRIWRQRLGPQPWLTFGK